MKRKDTLKALSIIAMLLLVFCLLPVAADAATATGDHGLKFSMESGSCAVCDGQSAAVTKLKIDEVTLEGKELTVTYTYTLDCPDDAAHFFTAEAVYEGFVCTNSYKNEKMKSSDGTVFFTHAAGHTIGSWNSNGDETHRGTCTLCGETETGDCSGDSNANCSNPGNCTKCGGTYTREDDHAYSWKNDGTNHWQECAHNASHRIGEGTCAVGSSGKAATCMTPATCGTCGLPFGTTSDTGHVWGGWTYNVGETFHMRTCTLNENHKEGLLHGFDYALAPDDSGLLYGTCKTCGYHMEAHLKASGPVNYSGQAITPLTIEYSDTWLGEKVAVSDIVYSNNVNAGTATGTVTIENKKLVGSFEILPATLNVSSVSAKNRPYDGTNKVIVTKVSFSGKIGDDDVDFQTSEAAISSADVGTYNSVSCGAGDLMLKGKDKGNYKVASGTQISTDAPVVISPRTVKSTITASDSVYGKVVAPRFLFDGLLAQDTSYAVVTYEGTTEKVVNGEKVKYQGTAVPTEVGSYTVKVKLENANYSFTGDTSATFKIKKAPADYDAPKAKQLNYTGKNQELLTAGTVRGSSSTFQYKREKDTTWSTTIPTGKSVGSEVILWRIEEDANHEAASGKVTTSIDKAVITVTPTAGQKATYGAARPDITYTVKGAVGSEVPAFTGKLAVFAEDVGAYDIGVGTLALKDNGAFKAANYKIKLEKVKYNVNPAYMTLKAEDQTITYGTAIDSNKYTVTSPVESDRVTVTLTPSGTNVTYGGTITPTAVIKNAEGVDVSQNYYVTMTVGNLVIEPNFGIIENLTAENVACSQKADIEQLQDSLHKADITKATLAQIKRIDEAKEVCTVLLAQIEKATQAAETDAVKKTGDITEENVVIADKASIEQAISDLEKVVVDFAGNYSEEDLKKLEAHLAQLKGALESITKVQSVINMLGAMPDTVKAEDEIAAQIRAAYGDLTDYEKGLVNASSNGKWLDAVSYRILSGDGATWQKGMSMTFTVDGDYDRFMGVMVDGKRVDDKHYTSEAGSTVVTLKTSILKILDTKQAEHTISFQFNDGEIGGVFFVSKDALSGGFNFLSLLPWLVALLAAAAGGVFVYLRKKKTEQ